jgi:hypothetical protein
VLLKLPMSNLKKRLNYFHTIRRLQRSLLLSEAFFINIFRKWQRLKRYENGFRNGKKTKIQAEEPMRLTLKQILQFQKWIYPFKFSYRLRLVCLLKRSFGNAFLILVLDYFFMRFGVHSHSIVNNL